MSSTESSLRKDTLERTRRKLLELRGEHGHWEGELSSSALSTATAVVALESYANLVDSENRASSTALRSLIASGREWLMAHQNDDGGWGDTSISLSNISTTSLGWGALAGATQSEAQRAQQRCEAWLVREVGSLEPARLSQSISARYGKDRTFSVPILTMLALTGRLGSEQTAWKWIPQLPFELAACPHQWFAWLQLPVVSYALPALIAMGKVRHCRRPTWNPIARLLRMLVGKRTERVLRGIQPTTGGFLEATPLTSFVLMSLLGANGTPRDVIELGVQFLVRSVRPDGSWPIDTNLATWTTSLSVNAIHLDELETTDQLLGWLLGQQYRVEHPYTHAKPGGWAWTDLSGGVPDADDTSGALLAIRKLSGTKHRDSAVEGITWLLDLQNRDGGIPTFCRGWGALPFDRSSCDITAHALRAWMAWYHDLSPTLQKRIEVGFRLGLSFLSQRQRPDGAWAPLWFGNQLADPEENLVYGTSRVLLAIAGMLEQGPFCHWLPSRTNDAIQWTLRIQNSDGGWGAEANIPSSIEETGLAVESLAALVAAIDTLHDGDREHVTADKFALRRSQDFISLRPALMTAIDGGVRYLIDKTDGGTRFPPSPIGFYFAKLWYYERMYPIVYSLAAFERTSAIASREPSDRMSWDRS